MYDYSQDEYLEATKEARINQSDEEEVPTNGKKKFFILFILLSLLSVGYLGYDHMQKAKAIDDELVVSLETNTPQIPTATVEAKPVMEVVTTTPKEESPKEEPKNYRVITVKNGDTLASLSKKYLGNEMLFERIVELNEGLKETLIIKVGEEIRIPQ